MVSTVEGLKPVRSGRPPVFIFPASEEREYQKSVRSYLRDIRADVLETIKPEISRLHSRFNDSEQFHDTISDDVRLLIDRVKQNAQSGIESFRDVLSRLAEQLNRFNLVQFNRQIQFHFNLDLFRFEPWITDTLDSWVSENIALIQSIPDRYFSELETMILREIRAGTRIEQIARELSNRYGITEKRGLLIARDQIGKLNGQISRRRQTEAGIKKYIWRTVRDERVRPSHEANDGKVFSWKSPPKNTGHPGSDIQCRCYPEMVIED